MFRLSIVIFIIFALDFTTPNIEHNNDNLVGVVIECEFYEKANCTKNAENCKPIVKVCEPDGDKFQGCFVLWGTNNKTGQHNINMKGCFNDQHGCNQTECVDKSYDQNKGLNFCCCKGNMCNSDQRWEPTATKPTQAEENKNPENDDSEHWMWMIATVLILSFVVLGVGFKVFIQKNKQTMFNEIPTIEPELSVSSQCLVIRPIKLIEIKARGRFGTVWKGLMKNDEVAVKIFPVQDKQSWITEQEIYKLPRMNHPNVLYFIGAEKHVDPHVDFWLITEYHAHGSLCDYLKSHTVTWPELCKISESMARGLMHLHEEIPANKKEDIKPAVAHRDFKSKNVLLKSDLSACIADFGLALIFEPGQPCGDTHGQVGTRRYMAPEILEGAINFNRDSFLRIDVYACGLVLWELITRCTTHGGPVGEFILPFEAELGSHPTLEEMQENIVTKKLRPRIQEEWRTHPGLNAICDTIEECWDHDAEARLSSSCIMERLSQQTAKKYHPIITDATTTNNILNQNNTFDH